MEPTESSRHVTGKPAARPTGPQRVGDHACVLTGVSGGRSSSVLAGLAVSPRVRVVVASRGLVRVAACVCSVGARGTERKPLTALGLGLTAALYDARHTFVSTLMAAGVPVPEVAAYSGHSVGELAAVAAGDTRLRSQTTLAVYTHATGQAREMALAVVGAYLDRLLAAAPRLRSGLAS